MVILHPKRNTQSGVARRKVQEVGGAHVNSSARAYTREVNRQIIGFASMATLSPSKHRRALEEPESIVYRIHDVAVIALDYYRPTIADHMGGIVAIGQPHRLGGPRREHRGGRIIDRRTRRRAREDRHCGVGNNSRLRRDVGVIDPHLDRVDLNGAQAIGNNKVGGNIRSHGSVRSSLYRVEKRRGRRVEIPVGQRSGAGHSIRARPRSQLLNLAAGKASSINGEVVNLALEAAGNTQWDARTDCQQVEIRRQRTRVLAIQKENPVNPDLFVGAVLQEDEVVPTVPPGVVTHGDPGRQLVDVLVDALRATITASRSVKINGVIAPGQMRLKPPLSPACTRRIEKESGSRGYRRELRPKGDAEGVASGSRVQGAEERWVINGEQGPAARAQVHRRIRCLTGMALAGGSVLAGAANPVAVDLIRCNLCRGAPTEEKRCGQTEG